MIDTSINFYWISSLFQAWLSTQFTVCQLPIRGFFPCLRCQILVPLHHLLDTKSVSSRSHGVGLTQFLFFTLSNYLFIKYCLQLDRRLLRFFSLSKQLDADPGPSGSASRTSRNPWRLGSPSSARVSGQPPELHYLEYCQYLILSAIFP